MGEQARGYSRPPFEEGNEVSLRHGAQSGRHLRPVVDRLLAQLPVEAPWTTGIAFRPTVNAWAWAEAQCELYRRHFDEHGLDPASEAPGAARWQRAESSAARLRAELALTPAALARLLTSLTALGPGAPTAGSGVAALRAEGAALRRAVQGATVPELEEGGAA